MIFRPTALRTLVALPRGRAAAAVVCGCGSTCTWLSAEAEPPAGGSTTCGWERSAGGADGAGAGAGAGATVALTCCGAAPLSEPTACNEANAAMTPAHTISSDGRKPTRRSSLPTTHHGR